MAGPVPGPPVYSEGIEAPLFWAKNPPAAVIGYNAAVAAIWMASSRAGASLRGVRTLADDVGVHSGLGRRTHPVAGSYLRLHLQRVRTAGHPSHRGLLLGEAGWLDRCPATYHPTHGTITYFHGCYSVGYETL